METRHIANFSLPKFKSAYRYVAVILGFVCLLVALYYDAPRLLFVGAFLVIVLLVAGYYLMLRSRVLFTLTPTHFQQHFYKGGWVLKWSNIEKIGLCTYQQDGWHQPLPWIGIKIRDYAPYLDSICPKITTELLLNQRALLYLGAKQAGHESKFEDIVLDSSQFNRKIHFSEDDHNVFIDQDALNASKVQTLTKERDKRWQYSGLQAMLANRMRYQREYHGYDIFISTNDLKMTGEEFVGLARRYLAAAEREQ